MGMRSGFEAAPMARSARGELLTDHDRVARSLSEVDHLLAHRQTDGTYDQSVLSDISTNLFTAVQEAAMPYAVTETRHEVAEIDGRRTFMWLGKTAVQAAESGFDFHISKAGQARVKVEVDEARHAEHDMKPGITKVFISPRMSEKDAPKEVAEAEHVAHDDAVRVSWLETDTSGRVVARKMQSLLVRDIPLDAWVRMLADPNNIFGKSVAVDDPESALAVMKVHRELELPTDKLPEGPVSLVEALIPYVDDLNIAESLERQLALFRCDQNDLQKKAKNIAERWLEFEKQLAESIYDGVATEAIRVFIGSLQQRWDKDALAALSELQTPNGGYMMTRQLAAILEDAQKNILWTSAAVISGNEKVMNQMDSVTLRMIQKNELAIQAAQYAQASSAELQARNSRMIAGQNIEVRGGCAGSTKGRFNDGDPDVMASVFDGEGVINPNNKESRWGWKKGICRTDNCPTKPGVTDVGPCNICRTCQHAYDRGSEPSYTPASDRQKTLFAQYFLKNS
jgi:hypothetical protein